jgi:hypothetical protein
MIKENIRYIHFYYFGVLQFLMGSMWQHQGIGVVLQLSQDSNNPNENGLKSRIYHEQKVMINLYNYVLNFQLTCFMH